MGYFPKRWSRRTERQQGRIGSASALQLEKPEYGSSGGNPHRMYRNPRPAKEQRTRPFALRTFIYDKEHQKYIDDIASKRKTMVSTGDRSAKSVLTTTRRRITDHRINYTIYNLAAFMDGDIQDCIDHLIVAENAERLKESEL